MLRLPLLLLTILLVNSMSIQDLSETVKVQVDNKALEYKNGKGIKEGSFKCEPPKVTLASFVNDRPDKPIPCSCTFIPSSHQRQVIQCKGSNVVASLTACSIEIFRDKVTGKINDCYHKSRY